MVNMKKLVIFTTTKLNEMLNKGNVLYVRHYEKCFSKVYVVYLLGNKVSPVEIGNTTLISLSTGNTILDLFIAPLRLFIFIRKVKPDSYLSADILFSWWTSLFIRIFLGAEFILMPDCIPDDIHKSTGYSMTIFPKSVEKLMVNLSILSSYRVLTSRNFGRFVEWLTANRLCKRKLLVVDKVVESLPSPDFLKKVRESYLGANRAIRGSVVCLIYVGRLHPQKMPEDLLEILATLRVLRPGIDFNLTIVGEGQEKGKLLQLAEELGITSMLRWVDSVSNDRLPDYYLSSDIYVSTATGTSLREAALCGLPIVAYDTDWVKGLLKDQENALLVPPRDVGYFATAIVKIVEDADLRSRISSNIRDLAWKMWDDKGLKEQLDYAFA
jgi:glycosyltransferase involved in cell wall biosynthesis